MLFVFDGGTLPDTTALTPDGIEIAEARFHDPATLPDLMPDRLSRRLTVALEAAQTGTPTYAEYGTSHPSRAQRTATKSN